ncbi:unnamed protein product [Vitrella brassicaformis CCMP3155]|uniref:VOC domain-containing protein n=2 Tax=Vitrella brassicaformis TaxID=1169539 RepID=A0A0G4FRZ8_VITBC|nr:unnamed protein product [Vitrella brassicaformis CCMP3155]|eukprot:CEM16881.1 unnamed protein product [Vitrella brassicaformis CCMP3155]
MSSEPVEQPDSTQLGLVCEVTSKAAVEHAKWIEKGVLGENKGCYKDDKTGKVMHLHVKVHGCDLYMADNFDDGEEKGLSGCTMHLNVANADEWYNRAIEHGAKVTYELQNTFWGARYGRVLDPFGLTWAFHQELPKDHHDDKRREADCPVATATAEEHVDKRRKTHDDTTGSEKDEAPQ